MTELNFETLIMFLGFIISVAGYLWKTQRALNQRFDNLMTAMQVEKDARVMQSIRGTTELEKAKELASVSIARLDRDLSVMQERMSQVPTRHDLEDIIRSRLSPIESDIKELTIQLVRLGLHEAKSRIRKHGDQFDD